MITFSTNIQTALNNDVIDAFYMVRILDSAGSVVYNTTSHYYDVQLTSGGSVASGYLYSSNDGLISIDPPQLTTNVDREQYKILLADNDYTKSSFVNNNIVGKIIEVRIGFINITTNAPYFELTDTVIVYKGKIDSASYLVKTSTMGERVVQLTGSSPMRSLDMKRAVYLGKDAARQANPKDSSCDQIYEGSGSITLKWGRI